MLLLDNLGASGVGPEIIPVLFDIFIATCPRAMWTVKSRPTPGAISRN
jgi:hypothetical protein